MYNESLYLIVKYNTIYEATKDHQAGNEQGIKIAGQVLARYQ